MTGVVELKTRPVQTNASTIAVLRSYLEKAEKGEIVAVAIAAVEPGGACYTQISETDHLQVLLGAIAILQFRMIESRRAND